MSRPRFQLRRQTLFVVLTAVGLAASLVRAADGDKTPTTETASGQSVRGVLIGKSGFTLEVQVEGEPHPRRYSVLPPRTRLDPKSEARFRELPVGGDVQFTLSPAPGGRIATNVLVVHSPGTFGKSAGVIINKSNAAEAGKPAWWIEIKTDQGKTERYMPHWLENGFDKEMLAALAERSMGDRVEIHWVSDDHVRVDTLRILALAPPKVAQPDKAGEFVGKVVDKGKDWITLRAEDGSQERYLPQRIIGAKDSVDNDVVRAIAAAKPGDRLEAKWFRDGERRLYSLKKPAAVK